MMRRSIPKSAKPLPFPEWIEKTYPQKTPARSFLQMIGALDLVYLMYRMNKQPEKVVSEQRKPVIPVMPLKVEDHKRPVAKKPTKPRVKKAAKPKKVEKDEELTIEFEHKPEPVIEKKAKPVTEQPIEPEPLELEMNVPAMDSPSPGRRVGKTERGPGGEAAWLDDERLDDIDLRKTDLKLETGGISVAFETSYSDDEEETMIVVNGVPWRAMLTSPALNLSRMLQVTKVSYGELYVLGRMALGAMSGEGYIAADEAARIVAELSAATDKTVELDMQYHDKDRTSKKRATHTIRIRFERVS